MNQAAADHQQQAAGAGSRSAGSALGADRLPASLLRWLLFFAALVLLHWPLLHLPYFWDEAGYYVPAARDIYLYGDLIPRTTLSNAHPPLVLLWIAAWWKLLGYQIIVARVAMLAVSGFALNGVFRLASRVSCLPVAWAAVACTALYPVYFAQSSMAHVDLAAAAFTVWGLGSYLRRERWQTALWFAAAALSKETAILAPMSLFAWELVQMALLWRAGRPGANGQPAASERAGYLANLLLHPEEAQASRITRAAFLLLPLLPLAAWFAYHYAATGYIFGNPEFVRYNVTATMQPTRILLALLIRVWQAFGYEHLWLLTGLMLWAMRLPAQPDSSAAGGTRPRIAIPAQVAMLVVVLAYVCAMAVVGGAVLARYMLPVIPLVILPWVSTLWRRTRSWRAIVPALCAFFALGWVWNPPYEFSPEDNLAYRDFIELQQHGIAYLQQHHPTARVLTAWPASDELTRPFLGYVPEPRNVLRVENFTVPEMMLAAGARNDFQVALVFSTKYEPTPLLPGLRPEWDRLKSRFFDYHRDVDPAAAAAMLGGRLVFEQRRQGLFVSVIEVQPIALARSGQ